MKEATAVNYRLPAALLLIVVLIGCGHQKPRLDGYFDGFKGTIVIYDEASGRYTRYNETRAAKRFSPCSTFKIPNALIALETGVIKSSQDTIKWNQQLYPKQDWWTDDPWATWARDHTMESAIKYSVVWYFKELAKRIGPERYEEYLAKMNYGNRDISGGLTNFWLVSSLKISAHEQVEFLKNFYHNRFGFNPGNIAQVKDALILEESQNYRLSGKTGTGVLGETTLGWLVGYLEKDGNVWFYALNLEHKDYDQIRSSRMEIVKNVFREMGVIRTPQRH